MPGGRSKLIHAQTVLVEDDAKKLQEKTHKSSIKDALAAAVYYYLDNAPEGA